ncbi:hypothetical protein SARC_07777 [Sphaeroforma arctica JP610]|uniref:Uncharacterized protein n=1 Tax=Sphaeroforma arctica JP610 TaxID=667725 RepID=A0A0L0FT25_9EUKA|nr:hypothetical protein SARC_07777 [Sphaeroforma arctica JP610]KNC79839.1 hypothetical protein SARC_07777 [Sphaeroforma arctica JP610]|eukprot:XP_014153741.1 hypothetical protein SARC_07777 [Sphaeroforma arctica JP610]
MSSTQESVAAEQPNSSAVTPTSASRTVSTIDNPEEVATDVPHTTDEIATAYPALADVADVPVAAPTETGQNGSVPSSSSPTTAAIEGDKDESVLTDTGSVDDITTEASSPRGMNTGDASMKPSEGIGMSGDDSDLIIAEMKSEEPESPTMSNPSLVEVMATASTAGTARDATGVDENASDIDTSSQIGLMRDAMPSGGSETDAATDTVEGTVDTENAVELATGGGAILFNAQLLNANEDMNANELGSNMANKSLAMNPSTTESGIYPVITPGADSTTASQLGSDTVVIASTTSTVVAYGVVCARGSDASNTSDVGSTGSVIDKGATLDLVDRSGSGISQRAMALAGGRAASGIENADDLARSHVSYRDQVPVVVPGDEDAEAYKKSLHLLSQARKRHTLQSLHAVQLTGVLPVTKQLQKTVDQAQKSSQKIQARMEKHALAEAKQRDDEITALEKRLNKALTYFSKQMYADEAAKGVAGESRTLEEIEIETRRIKWPQISEYDRLLSHRHLEDMKFLYRVRLLDYTSVYEQVHASEWHEVDKIEDREWNDLDKECNLNLKALEKDLSWGLMSKITGKKTVDGVKLTRAELETAAEEKKNHLTAQQEVRCDELREMQKSRCTKLAEGQEKTVQDLVITQTEAMKSLAVDTIV